ncbi:hypothetical protein J2754_001485 [Halarchaeum solikamskense]|uniref:hypothetical protein n=1 Tax=Halarchaeum nitratireducens TaxID=489913 RepID=UPI001B3AB87C|nr:hypothetical protein [Halarchaeum solikamskense]MBP2251164.1 hypothetical protein [Halarchaeum solikamskense]
MVMFASFFRVDPSPVIVDAAEPAVVVGVVVAVDVVLVAMGVGVEAFPVVVVVFAAAVVPVAPATRTMRSANTSRGPRMLSDVGGRSAT